MTPKAFRTWNFSYLPQSYKTGEFDAGSPVSHDRTFTHRFGQVDLPSCTGGTSPQT